MHKEKRIIRLFHFFLLLVFLSIPFSSFSMIYMDIPNEANSTIADIADQPFIDDVSTAYMDDDIQEVTYYKQNFPLKTVQVDGTKKKHVIPGGESIGIQLQSSGVVVVGHHKIEGEQIQSPAKKANIEIGDIILSVNDKKVDEINDIPTIIEKYAKDKKAMEITLKRGEKEISTKVKPIYNEKEKKYQIGLYMKNASSGIGTITFYDEETGKYGALGHTINDAMTNKPVDIHDGKIVLSKVIDIEKGNKGIPGEKKATFSMKKDLLGDVIKNSPYGIYGTLNNQLLKKEKPLEVGYAHEIKKGPAEIWTVIEGNEIEKFDVEIIHASKQSFKATKGIIVKVTDKRLLEKTGGIVQGMSGSPIIQNGKIIGAVTHVFVNDPTSGYGVHIEWMLDEANLSEQHKNNAA